MQKLDHKRYVSSGSPEVFGLLARVGEQIAAEPDNLEGALRGMVEGLRDVLGLRRVVLSVELGEERRISAQSGPFAAGVVEFPIRRGKIPVGVLRAYPYGGADGLDASGREALRMAAGMVALALDAAHARELAARRAAHGSVVQIASEALGAILDEEQLYNTVLVLTLELLDATGGAILLDEGETVGLGLEGDEETIAALGEVPIRGRSPWIGRIRGQHTLGVGLGGAYGGAVFLLRGEKPYTETEGVSLKLVARQLARARERSKLYASLERTTIDAISALAAALESRDGTTGEHIKRTQALAGDVARKMGLGPDEVRDVQYAAVLHDVGKIGIPDSILNKPGRLDPEEWDFMRRHPRIGAEIVSRIKGFERVSRVILAHHERHDGCGYPAGLSGTDVPVGARLISVIDAYDAMTNDRPYRAAMSHEEAIAELKGNSGAQFDPEVVAAMEAVLGEQEGEQA